jgi:GWxTD domain-containing protein
MKKRNLIFILFILLQMTSTTLAIAQGNSDHRLYLDAKKKSFGQQWGGAAQLFQQLVDEFPESEYQEEAQFWVGYCLEKDGDTAKAYISFTRLQTEFPNSLWLDDALQHKIVLAEKLAAQRGDQYYVFLRRQLLSKDKDIQFQSGIALGRLGDKSALETLNSLRGHVSFDAEAEELITALEQAKDVADEAVYAEGIVGSFRGEDAQQQVFRINPGDDRVNYFPERRFEQYRSMARKNDNWNYDELIRFGMWHIMPTEAFDEYSNLDSVAKREWLRIFWKKNDPTPTTNENEGKLEFERRVTFARKSFHYFDNLNSFYYAPWDARGEIYVKFGAPDNRTKNSDGELWSYPFYENVAFFIRPNVTNIFGRSIFISSLNNESLRSNSRMGNVARWRKIHNELIFQPGFHFAPQTDYSPIKDFKLLTSRKRIPGLEFRYRMPTSEFTSQKKDGYYSFSYLESYVVFDKKMEPVAQHKMTREFSVPNKDDIKKQKTIEQNVNVELEPGDYTLGLRIEDPLSKKIAIRKIDIKVGK